MFRENKRERERGIYVGGEKILIIHEMTEVRYCAVIKVARILFHA